jgi:hypothetical protein
MVAKANNLLGNVFSRLTVFEKSNTKASDGSIIWLCKCSCGSNQIIKAVSYELKRGGTTSCGCLRKEKLSIARTTHGFSSSKGNKGKCSPTYDLWGRIKDRCYNKSSKDYKDYGGRGIKLYQPWVKDFLKFKSYVELLPNYPKERVVGIKKVTIDRKNNSKGYVPGNLRWASYTQQNRNKRDNLLITYKGKTMLFIEIVEKYSKVPYKIVYDRVNIFGWSLHKALATPKRGIKNEIKRKLVRFNKSPGMSV